MRGIWQLARQSLTIDSRRLGQHAIRFGLVVVLYVAVCLAVRDQWRSSTGLSLFKSQLMITEFFLSVTAIFGFSQAITEEKEEDRLGLIRLADISPLAIILGKMSGLLFESALLIGIQFPFTIIAITLGGVSWPQVAAAYVALATYLWLLACVGMAASVVQPTGGRAARLTAVFVLFYTLLPLTPAGVLPFGINPLWYRPISLSLRLIDVTESGFAAGPWCSAVQFGLILGLTSLLISWRMLDRLALTEPAVERRISIAINRRVARRPWSLPVTWRDYIFLTGGYPWTVIRILTQLPIVFIAAKIAPPAQHFGYIFAWSALIGGLVSVMDGTWSASRLFRDEIRFRTWSALVQTPQPLTYLALQKCLGWFLGLLPSIFAPFLFIVLMILFHENMPSDGARIEVLVGTATIGISVFGYLHLLVLLSLYFGWKATPMTLTVCFAAAWVYVVAVFSSRSDTEMRITLFAVTSVVICGLMIVLQQLILRRLERLAETA